MPRHGARLAGPRNRVAPVVVGEIAGDGLEALVDRTPHRDLPVGCEQRLQAVLEIGQQEGADPCRLEQPHIAGLGTGEVDMRVERDARAPEHLIHILAPDLALEAAAERRGGGKGVRKIAPELEIVASGHGLEQRNPLLMIR